MAHPSHFALRHHRTLKSWMVFIFIMGFPVTSHSTPPSHTTQAASTGAASTGAPSAPPATPTKSETSSSSSPTSFWTTRSTPTIQITAPYAYILDTSTQTVLLDKQADERMAPSSMTKIMTVYMALKALQDGALSWKDRLYVSAHAAKQPGSRMFIRPQENILLADILKGIIVVSGNDACTVLAEHLSGDEGTFAQHMNAMAQRLGMKNSYFVNASGLPDTQQYSSCRDLAIVAERTIQEFPSFYASFYSIPSFTFNSVKQPNRHPLLAKKFADGLKTGMTNAGKYGLVASAKRGKRRLLLVINGAASSTVRAEESRRLLQWGFQNFTAVHIPKHHSILSIPLWPKGDVELITEREYLSTWSSSMAQKATLTVTYTQPLPLPIAQHQRLGALTIQLPQQPAIVIPLVARTSVSSPSLWSRAWSYLTSWGTPSLPTAVSSPPQPVASTSHPVVTPPLTSSVSALPNLPQPLKGSQQVSNGGQNNDHPGSASLGQPHQGLGPTP